jgi:hypothetical protein
MTEAFAIRLLDAADEAAAKPHVRVHDGHRLGRLTAWYRAIVVSLLMRAGARQQAVTQVG